MKKYFYCLLLAITACLAMPVRAAFDHTHAALDGILRGNVSPKGVNYLALKQKSSSLEVYLKTLAEVSQTDFKSWSKKQQMAMLINLYNAGTLKLVVDHYPVKSIKNIGSGSGGPWKQPILGLFGKMQTLDYIENNLLRPNYGDPRIHFAINCASIGCPALRSEAFQVSKLDEQLDEQTKEFLNDSSKNRVDASAKVLYLSPIFDWFKGDFVKKSGSVEKFIAPFLSTSDRKVVEQGGLKIKNTDYDWSLNNQ